MRKEYKTWVITTIALAVFPAARVSSDSTIYTSSITLKGTATGGKLIMADNMGRNARFVEVTTKSGESAETVIKNLAEAINAAKKRFGWATWDGLPPHQVVAQGPTLSKILGPSGWYFFTGTELGLGIPRPPLSLSCSYHRETDQIKLLWENPKNGYDLMWMVMSSRNARGGRIKLAGNATSLTIDRKEKPFDVNDLHIMLFGYKDNISSNAAVIYLDGNSQHELAGNPFTDNVAPNWRCWLMASDKNAVQFEQGVRKRFLFTEGFNGIKHPATKPFYQIIRTKSQDASAGVWRKFMGLTPGRTYRVAARINTLEMDSSKAAWEFSLHATYNAPGGGDLTAAQFAGLSPLPDASKGNQAGLIALYHPELTTKNTWERRSTGKQWRDEFVPDITLPKGVDTITIWIRCWSAKESAFGIDWVKLEDITAKDSKTSKQ